MNNKHSYKKILFYWFINQEICKSVQFSPIKKISGLISFRVTFPFVR